MNLEHLFEQKVNSSWIDEITYDDEKQVAIMTTLSGKDYEFPIDRDKYEEWLEYYSKGKFYHKKLKEGKEIIIFESSSKEYNYILKNIIDKRDENKLRELLNNGLDPNLTDKKGKTFLHHLTSPKDVKIAELLINSGADVNLQDIFGNTPLHDLVSLYRGELLVKLLVSRGADNNIKNNKGYTPADIAFLQRRFYNYVLTYSKQSRYKFSALVYHESNIEIIKFFIESHDVNINQKDYYGNTALMYSVIDEKPAEIIKLLLDNGAKNIPNNEGETPFKLAVKKGNKEIIDLFLTAKQIPSEELFENKNVDIFDAVKNNNIEGVKKALEMGVDVNIKNDEGDTALILAAIKGWTEIVQLLIDNGAKLDEKDFIDRTVLMAAARNGQTEIVRLLIDNGANVNEKNKWGDTALILAAKYGKTEIAQLLIDNGANINEKDGFSNTALLSSVLNSNKEIVQLLLDNGAKNIPNNKGDTPFKVAVKKGNREIIDLFLTAPQIPSEELFEQEIPNLVEIERIEMNENRKPGLSYSESKIKNAIDKVSVELKGSRGANFTRLASIYKKIDLEAKEIEEKRKNLNEILKKRSSELFDETDKLYTRVVETSKLTIMLTKESENEEVTEKINYKEILLELTGVLSEIEKALDEAGKKVDLLDKLNEIQKKHTEVKTIIKKTPTRLKVDLTESYLDNFKYYFRKSQRVIDNFVNKLKLKNDEFDYKLRDLDYDIRELLR